MKKFTRFILGTALFYFVFSFAALYFFIVNDFVWSLMVSLISTVIFVPANIALQKFLNGYRFSRPVRPRRQSDK